MERLTTRHSGVAVIKDRSRIKEAMEKLARYEEQEELGLMLKLPCKVGTKVFFVNDDLEDIYLPSTKYYYIDEDEFDVSMLNYLGESVFLTKEEAEAKLKELQNESDN